MIQPEITVVIPVYRGASTLPEALDSVIDQKVGHMEIIVLDDGSPDDSGKIAEAYSANLDNVDLQVYRHPNRGLAATLNRGIELAQGNYISRQDQDDIVLPGRLEKQKAFLDANPTVAMVGTWAAIHSGDTPTHRYHRHPTSHESLQLELLFDNPFVHSSMMIRTDVLREIGGYCEDKSRQPPEDYELWSRIARRYRVANLPEVLTVYREMPGSMSRTGENPFLNKVIHISTENLLHILAPNYSAADCGKLAELYHRGGMDEIKFSLPKKQVYEMLSTAAQIIGGPREAWSDEFLSSFHRMRAHLDTRFLRRRIPKAFLKPARWLKNRFMRTG